MKRIVNSPKPIKEPSSLKQAARMIKLVKFLTEFRTIKECAHHLERNPQSVRRYLDALAQFGFKIKVLKRYRYQYKINNHQTFFKDEVRS